MIFNKTSRINSNLHFSYNSLPLEIVTLYRYLGVYFSNNGIFKTALDQFATSTRVAMASVFRTLHRCKADTFAIVEKLFLASISSTLMYCAQIWSLHYLDDLEKIQLQFFKKLYRLRFNTLGYAVRAETGRNHIKLDILKALINYLIKILKMPNNRYPKICFETLKNLAVTHPDSKKYNWFLQVSDMLSFTNINLHSDNDTLLNTLLLNKANILTSLKNQLHISDVTHIRKSSCLPISPKLVYYPAT